MDEALSAHTRSFQERLDESRAAITDEDKMNSRKRRKQKEAGQLLKSSGGSSA